MYIIYFDKFVCQFDILLVNKTTLEYHYNVMVIQCVVYLIEFIIDSVINLIIDYNHRNQFYHNWMKMRVIFKHVRNMK